MSKHSRILLRGGIAIAGILVALIVTALIVIRTDRFRAFVQEKIISAIYTSIGGRAEIGRLTFDARELRAHLDRLVIHGNEPAAAEPFLQIKSIDLQVKLFTGWMQLIGLESLSIEQPAVNVMVLDNGQTNVPSPPSVTKPGDTSALETVVDLAVRHFTIEGGVAQLSGRETDFSGRGENLRVALRWNLLGQRYEGDISVNPVVATPPGRRSLQIAVHLPVQIEKDRIRITGAIISTPQSQVSLSGSVENMKAPVTSADVNGSFSLAEVANVLGGGPAGSVQGTIQLSGHARIVNANDYTAVAQLNGSDISLAQAGHRLNNLRLSAAIDANAREVAIKDARLEALGGELDGNAEIRNLADLTAAVQIKNFDIQNLARVLAGVRLPYAGSVSGTVRGTANLKASDTSSATAQAELTIAPRSTGTPVSGRIAAAYNGANGTVPLRQVQLALPNTRLEAHGTLGQQVDVQITSHNLSDFPVGATTAPIALRGGVATVTAQVRGPINSPRVSGHAAITRFSVAQRQFDQLVADLTASASGASVQNGRLTRGALQAQFAGAVGLHNWTVTGADSIMLTTSLRNADLADALAFAGQSAFPAAGVLSADANISGTIGNPQGTAEISVLRGTLYQDMFDSLTASLRLSDQLVSAPSVHLTAGPAVLDGNARFTHPRDSMSTGHLEVHVASNDLSLAQFQSLQQRHRGLAGILRVNADAAGDLRSNSGATEFTLASIAGNLRAQGLRDTRETFGDLTATAQTSRSTVDFHLDSNFAGSSVQANGQTQLVTDYPTTARVAINALPVEKVLSVAGSSIPARGMLSANADLSGKKEDLRSHLDFRLTNGVLYQESFNRIEGVVNYAADSIGLQRLSVDVPAGSLDVSGSFSHAPNDYNGGRVDLRVDSRNLDLARIANVQRLRPGLGGRARLAGEISGTIATRNGSREVMLTKGDASGGVSGLAVNGTSLGDATLRAETKGDTVSFNLESDIAKSNIQGNGQVKLAPDYPVDAKLVFKNVTYSGFQGVIGSGANPSMQLDALAEGQLTVSGPARELTNVRAELQLSRLEASTSRPNAKGKASTLALKNQGPIVVSLEQRQIRVMSAKLAGTSAEISVSGTAQLDKDRSMDLAVNGNVDLALLQGFNRDIFSAGAVGLNAKIGGTLAQPNLGGRAELKNASFSMADLPNGVSAANGVIVFSGTRATVQSLTAKVGGGETSVTGFANYAGADSSCDLQVKGTKIRTRYQGASIVTDVALQLTGTNQRSTLSGDVTIQQVTYAPESDLGTMLASASTPPAQTEESSPLLSNMRLNVRIQTAPGAVFRTTMARTLEAAADLRLRGTAQRPGMTGRIDITRGELVFFGNQYTVDEGDITFYDPSKIEPIVNTALETKAKGIGVTLKISGPIDDLKLSYTSDPPLRFDEIVALLATGKTPSDPTIVSHQPAPPQQSVAQMGESAVVQQAAANPLANGLQRVFGVSQLKIDPTFASGSALPQARLTLQQQVTPDITFSYTTDLTQSNSQLIRVEWAFNPRFSAVATREENGLVGLDFLYKKQFR